MQFGVLLQRACPSAEWLLPTTEAQWFIFHWWYPWGNYSHGRIAHYFGRHGLDLDWWHSDRCIASGSNCTSTASAYSAAYSPPACPWDFSRAVITAVIIQTAGCSLMPSIEIAIGLFDPSTEASLSVTGSRLAGWARSLLNSSAWVCSAARHWPDRVRTLAAVIFQHSVLR